MSHNITCDPTPILKQERVVHVDNYNTDTKDNKYISNMWIFFILRILG